MNHSSPAFPRVINTTPAHEHCGRCHYLHIVAKPDGAPKEMPTLTVCRRLPPQLVPVLAVPEAFREMQRGVQAKAVQNIPMFPMALQSTAQFPLVGIDDWCGEFVGRQGA